MSDAPKTPPHDLDAEKSILGACMLDETAVDTATGIVQPVHFYHPAHAWIYEAMVSLRQRTQPVDIITVAGELRARERLNTIGGPQYLGELTDTIPTVAHLETYCYRVRGLHAVRDTIMAAGEIIENGYRATDLAAYQADAQRRIMSVADVATNHEPVEFAQCLQESFEAIEKAMERKGRTAGHSTGLADLDRLTTGMHPGEVWVVAGRSGMGKTALGMQLVVELAEHVGPALVHELEMPRVQLSNRVLCSEGRVDQSRMRSNMLTADDSAALAATAQRIFSLPIWIDDRPADITRIQRCARKRKADRGLAALFVDHLTLVKVAGGDRPDLEYGRVADSLKDLAKELNIVVILGVQINRNAVKTVTGKGESPRPKAHHLAESDKIAQAADVVCLIHREEVFNPNTEDRGIAELIIDKQRNGPFPVTARTRFVGAITRFENLSEEEYATAYDARRDRDAAE
jgi:replicative DNA helicase